MRLKKILAGTAAIAVTAGTIALGVPAHSASETIQSALPSFSPPEANDDDFVMPAGATAVLDVLGNDDFVPGVDQVWVIDQPDDVWAHFDDDQLVVTPGLALGGSTIEIVYEIDRGHFGSAQATLRVEVLPSSSAGGVTQTVPYLSEVLGGPGATVTLTGAIPAGYLIEVTDDNRIQIARGEGPTDLWLGERQDVSYRVSDDLGYATGHVTFGPNVDPQPSGTRADHYTVRPGQWVTLDVTQNDDVGPVTSVEPAGLNGMYRGVRVVPTADRKQLRFKVSKRWIGKDLSFDYLVRSDALWDGGAIGRFHVKVQAPKGAPVVRDERITMRKDGPRVVNILRNDATRGKVTLRLPRKHIVGTALNWNGVTVKVTKNNRIRIKTNGRMTAPSITIPYTVTDRSGHTVWGELTVRRPILARRDHVTMRRGAERRVDVLANDVSSTGKLWASVRHIGKAPKGIRVKVGTVGRMQVKVGKRVKPGRYKVRYRLVAGKQRSQSFVTVRVRK